VSISDLSASVISFGNSLTVWVTKANKPFSMKKDELVVDAQFWGVCDTFVKPKLTDVKLLLTHTTSRQGLWRVPLASLRFHCTDAVCCILYCFHSDEVLTCLFSFFFCRARND
jgi:hypothetical protein